MTAPIHAWSCLVCEEHGDTDSEAVKHTKDTSHPTFSGTPGEFVEQAAQRARGSA